ncbi:uncharacterized protein CLUP02_01997 [Colletotrichum lupini]|uniref:Uncharacterized protein n=1 Tax=Colletotrichum lupini TaxID=145971 RepID=A0A9Q8SE23_9PEZI|nr:uncharacterized protein CLUP02_01997 [Colletotrichum lupini]UQC75343.1 hypothetical protein CLUP02_01997 [Colletotrichum lupini]
MDWLTGSRFPAARFEPILSFCQIPHPSAVQSSTFFKVQPLYASLDTCERTLHIHTATFPGPTYHGSLLAQHVFPKSKIRGRLHVKIPYLLQNNLDATHMPEAQPNPEPSTWLDIPPRPEPLSPLPLLRFLPTLTCSIRCIDVHQSLDHSWQHRSLSKVYEAGRSHRLQITRYHGSKLMDHAWPHGPLSVACQRSHPSDKTDAVRMQYGYIALYEFIQKPMGERAGEPPDYFNGLD